MKVTLLKDHNQYAAGDHADVEDGIGEYLVRMGVAEPAGKEKKEIPHTREKKEHKPGKEKKEI